MSPSPVTPVMAPPPDTAAPPRRYDGTSLFPTDAPPPARTGTERVYVSVTAVIVVLPFVALGLVGRLLWGRRHPLPANASAGCTTCAGRRRSGSPPVAPDVNHPLTHGSRQESGP